MSQTPPEGTATTPPEGQQSPQTPQEPQADPEKGYWERFKKEVEGVVDQKLGDALKVFTGGSKGPASGPAGTNRTTRPQTFPEILHDIVFGKPKE